MKNAPDLAGDEQWFDCETHSPVDLKEGQRTPEHKATPSHCPPAPCRYGQKFQPDSDDELDDVDDDLDLSGVEPLDTSIEIVKGKQEKSPDCKRLRRETVETIPMETMAMDTIVEPSDSKFSDLHYLETSGIVSINRQAASTDESERRECKMFVSYRVHKSDPSIVQIALIVYKSNSTNPKTRRNLMAEFEQKSEMMSPCTTNVPSSSRCRTVNSRKKPEAKAMQISTEPAKNTKAIKRPMISKTSLRF
jgi:hypothetical protein